LSELHPADIADILEQLDIEDAGAMLGRLDMETAADALNEVEAPLQYELLSELNPEHASDLLERLAPDDAADILADLPQAEIERLLNLMPANDAQHIRELLRYGAETAGGIMTTEVLALTQESTVEEVLTELRRNSQHLEMIYYLYMIDDARHLTGVVSLRQLVTATPTTRMRDLMDTDVIKVRVDTDQEDVARIIAKYDLLGVPVVDKEDRLVGLITVDDVIDVIHEEQTEDFSEIAGADIEEAGEFEHFTWPAAVRRLIWPTVNLVIGFALALLLNRIFQPIFASYANYATTQTLASVANFFLNSTNPSISHIALSGLICFVPTLLLTSGSTGSQSLGIAGWKLRSKRGTAFWEGILRELLLGTFAGILTSILIALLSWLLLPTWSFSLTVAFSFGISMFVASACGILLPNLLQRLRLRGSLITAPLLDPVIAALSLSAFLGTALTFLR
jgi:Mg/Co/Ni transporter MgtE